jgi:hypothetical protein
MGLVIAILLAVAVVMLIRLEWRLGQLVQRFRVIGSAITSRQNRVHRGFRSDATPTIERPRTTRRDSSDLPSTAHVGRVKREVTSDRRGEDD